MTVPEGDTLTIDSGVEVIAKYVSSGSKLKLDIRGTLLAQGEVEDLITFSCVPKTPGSWEGIMIYGDAEMEYRQIGNAVNRL